jgi:hypothetical protein
VQVIGSACSQGATGDCVDICESENDQEWQNLATPRSVTNVATPCHSALRKDGEFVALQPPGAKALAKSQRHSVKFLRALAPH